MAYLTQAKLYKIYPEILNEIGRATINVHDTLSDFPSPGIERYFYKANDTGLYYIWDGSNYVQNDFIDRIQKSINEGIGKAKSYLNRYDLVKMFSDDDTKRTFQDDFLDGLVLDIVCWYVVRISPPNIDMEVYKDAHNTAVKFLEKVQAGGPDPDGWPLKADNPDTPNDDAGNIMYVSFPKRINNY